MRNRAKCKLCNSIIESFTLYDYVICACEEISISGGAYELNCSAKDFANFVRVDDQGNELTVTVVEKKDNDISPSNTLNKKELIDMLEEMVKSIEHLPQEAMTSSINHYDFASALLLIISILRST